MILHIVVDSIFIDMANKIFEKATPGQNFFIYVGKERPANIKKTPITIISKKMFLSDSFAQSLVKYDMVILHYLSDNNLQFIAKIPKDIKVIWIGWGADYYDLITGGDESKLFLPITKSLYEINRKKMYVRIVQKIKKGAGSIILGNVKKKELINRINYFSAPLIEDYILIKIVLPNFSPRYIFWNYGTLEDDLIYGFENLTFSGNNILIGNSATYENNHLDTFKFLSEINMGGRRIISPVSYGNPEYRDIVIRFGKNYWGSHFIPLVEFMPLEKYIEILRTCSVVIMNHIRQQALGNIIATMNFGAKIFLNTKNPIYQFFKKEGAYIYSINQLESEINTPLTEDQIKHNRTILMKHWSREIQLIKTKKLIEIISKEC
jgi:hypothetical protein